MRKNYSFVNKLAGIMLTVSMTIGLTSCEDILGEWDKPSPIVQTIVENTGATPEEVTALINEALSTEAVQQAISSGQPIKVTVAGGSSTTASDQTITIPASATGGVEIELTFTQAITATEVKPLEIKAEGVSESATSGDSQSELTVAMPDATGLVVTIDLPTTTVTLTTTGTNTVYKSIVAKTATNTLIVENGVTVEELQIKGGTVKVMDGGKVETLVSDGTVGTIVLDNNGASIQDTEDESHPSLITNANGETCYFKTVKIAAPEGGAGEYGSANYNPCIIKGECDYENRLDKIIVADGAALEFDAAAFTADMGDHSGTGFEAISVLEAGIGPHVQLVEGAGSGTGILPLKDNYYLWYGYIKEVKNITIVNSSNSNATFNIESFANYENCTINGYWGVDICGDDLECTYKGLTINSNVMGIQSALNVNRDLTFKDCNFNNEIFMGLRFLSTDPENIHTLNLTFDNCYYLGKVIDFDSDFFTELMSKIDTPNENPVDLTGKANLNITINGQTKKYALTTWDAENYHYNYTEIVE